MQPKRLLSLAAALVLALSLLQGVSLAEQKPDTWIADRVIQVQAYVDDIGGSLPDDQLNTPVMQELKRRTGMQMVSTPPARTSAASYRTPPATCRT